MMVDLEMIIREFNDACGVQASRPNSLRRGEFLGKLTLDQEDLTKFLERLYEYWQAHAAVTSRVLDLRGWKEEDGSLTAEINPQLQLRVTHTAATIQIELEGK